MHVDTRVVRNLGDLGDARRRGGPVVEGMSRTHDMNVTEKSDGTIVPKRAANNAAEAAAESLEERVPAEGNAVEPTAARTQSRSPASSGIDGVRRAARMHSELKFTNLLHHVSVEMLHESYLSLKRRAAPGVDGERWEDWQPNLKERLTDLHRRLHSGAYRAKPARRTYIPKADGTERALSIWCLEDKVVQQAVVRVLGAIYETDFLGFSYGFREGRGQHDALDALSVALYRRKVNWVLDADIQKFFDQMEHDWVMRFVEHRVADKRILRLIRKWLRVGTQENGERVECTRGAPQGAVISPLLANIYLHYVADLWAEKWREKRTSGDVIIVRYADDEVFGFQHRSDATRFLADFSERLAKFGLSLHPKKTRLIRFGRFALRDRRREEGVKPETFDFLGFTHYCTVTRVSGRFMVGRKTIKKRMNASLREIKRSLRQRLHRPVAETGEWLSRVLRGHLNYFAVPGNFASLRRFFTKVAWYWMRSLRRRSQRHRMTWVRFNLLRHQFFPPIRLHHPYPNERFDVTHPR